METCKFFAELCFLFHCLVVAIITIGPYVQFYKKWIFYTFWGTFISGIGTNAAFGGCLFTICERMLRAECGEFIEFTEGFIAHYLNQWLGHEITAMHVNALVVAQLIAAIFMAHSARQRWWPWFSKLKAKLQFST